MVFQYVLANLLAHNDHALGALFLDGTGETVDLACGTDFSPYEMRVIGAYLASICASSSGCSRATISARRG